MIPITLIDQYRRIRSGGVAFVASTDEETLSWLLRTIRRLPPVAEKTRTLITDEDSAFIPALDVVMHEEPKWLVDHVLCAFHKEKNFIQRLMACGLCPVDRAVAKDMFKVICHCPHRETVDKTIKELKKMSPNLAVYIDECIVPLLPQFSRAYLSSVWTKGYNTTSPAEAHNAMYKGYMPSRACTLKQMRLDYTRAHQDAERNFKEKMERSFENDHFTYTTGGIMLSPKIRKEIDITNDLVPRFTCMELGEGRFKVFRTDARAIWHVATESECDCGRVENEGLPCAHILRVSAERNTPTPDAANTQSSSRLPSRTWNYQTSLTNAAVSSARVLATTRRHVSGISRTERSKQTNCTQVFYSQ